MFEVSLKNNEGLKVYQITNLKSGEYVTVLPEVGCALNNFMISKSGNFIDLIDGYKDSNDLRENMEKEFKGHFLFPFPNRIRKGTYTFKRKKNQLKINLPEEGNSIHGLLYNKVFNLKEYEETEDFGRVSFFKNFSGELEGYPFECLIVNEFKFTSRRLYIKSEVLNTGKKEMPVGIGWHPYFQTGSDISELYLEVSQSEQWNQKEICFIPTEALSGKGPLRDKRLDDCFKLMGAGYICLKDKKSGISIILEPEKDMSYYQIYTPDHGKSIAIEPMSCVPDSFNNKVGLRLLEKGELWTTGWSLKIADEK